MNIGQNHIPTDLVVAQEPSDVESSSRLDFLLLYNLGRRFID
jgi:sulfite exporter TauE/SafE